MPVELSHKILILPQNQDLPDGPVTGGQPIQPDGPGGANPPPADPNSVCRVDGGSSQVVDPFSTSFFRALTAPGPQSRPEDMSTVVPQTTHEALVTPDQVAGVRPVEKPVYIPPPQPTFERAHAELGQQRVDQIYGEVATLADNYNPEGVGQLINNIAATPQDDALADRQALEQLIVVEAAMAQQNFAPTAPSPAGVGTHFFRTVQAIDRSELQNGVREEVAGYLAGLSQSPPLDPPTPELVQVAQSHYASSALRIASTNPQTASNFLTNQVGVDGIDPLVENLRLGENDFANFELLTRFRADRAAYTAEFLSQVGQQPQEQTTRVFTQAVLDQVASETLHEYSGVDIGPDNHPAPLLEQGLAFSLANLDVYDAAHAEAPTTVDLGERVQAYRVALNFDGQIISPRDAVTTLQPYLDMVTPEGAKLHQDNFYAYVTHLEVRAYVADLENQMPDVSEDTILDFNHVTEQELATAVDQAIDRLADTDVTQTDQQAAAATALLVVSGISADDPLFAEYLAGVVQDQQDYPRGPTAAALEAAGVLLTMGLTPENDEYFGGRVMFLVQAARGNPGGAENRPMLPLERIRSIHGNAIEEEELTILMVTGSGIEAALPDGPVLNLAGDAYAHVPNLIRESITVATGGNAYWAETSVTEFADLMDQMAESANTDNAGAFAHGANLLRDQATPDQTMAELFTEIHDHADALTVTDLELLMNLGLVAGKARVSTWEQGLRDIETMRPQDFTSGVAGAIIDLEFGLRALFNDGHPIPSLAQAQSTVGFVREMVAEDLPQMSANGLDPETVRLWLVNSARTEFMDSQVLPIYADLVAYEGEKYLYDRANNLHLVGEGLRQTAKYLAIPVGGPPLAALVHSSTGVLLGGAEGTLKPEDAVTYALGQGADGYLTGVGVKYVSPLIAKGLGIPLTGGGTVVQTMAHSGLMSTYQATVGEVGMFVGSGFELNAQQAASHIFGATVGGTLVPVGPVGRVLDQTGMPEGMVANYLARGLREAFQELGQDTVDHLVTGNPYSPVQTVWTSFVIGMFAGDGESIKGNVTAAQDVLDQTHAQGHFITEDSFVQFAQEHGLHPNQLTNPSAALSGPERAARATNFVQGMFDRGVFFNESMVNEVATQFGLNPDELNLTNTGLATAQHQKLTQIYQVIENVRGQDPLTQELLDTVAEDFGLPAGSLSLTEVGPSLSQFVLDNGSPLLHPAERAQLVDRLNAVSRDLFQRDFAEAEAKLGPAAAANVLAVVAPEFQTTAPQRLTDPWLVFGLNEHQWAQATRDLALLPPEVVRRMGEALGPGKTNLGRAQFAGVDQLESTLGQGEPLELSWKVGPLFSPTQSGGLEPNRVGWTDATTDSRPSAVALLAEINQALTDPDQPLTAFSPAEQRDALKAARTALKQRTATTGISFSPADQVRVAAALLNVGASQYSSNTMPGLSWDYFILHNLPQVLANPGLQQTIAEAAQFAQSGAFSGAFALQAEALSTAQQIQLALFAEIDSLLGPQTRTDVVPSAQTAAVAQELERHINELLDLEPTALASRAQAFLDEVVTTVDDLRTHAIDLTGSVPGPDGQIAAPFFNLDLLSDGEDATGHLYRNLIATTFASSEPVLIRHQAGDGGRSITLITLKDGRTLGAGQSLLDLQGALQQAEDQVAAQLGQSPGLWLGDPSGLLPAGGSVLTPAQVANILGEHLPDLSQDPGVRDALTRTFSLAERTSMSPLRLGVIAQLAQVGAPDADLRALAELTAGLADSALAPLRDVQTLHEVRISLLGHQIGLEKVETLDLHGSPTDIFRLGQTEVFFANGNPVVFDRSTDRGLLAEQVRARALGPMLAFAQDPTRTNPQLASNQNPALSDLIHLRALAGVENNPTLLGAIGGEQLQSRQQVLLASYATAVENGMPTVSAEVLLERLIAVSSPYASNSPGNDAHMFEVLNDAIPRLDRLLTDQGETLQQHHIDMLARAVLATDGMGKLDKSVVPTTVRGLPIVPVTIQIQGEAHQATTAGEFWDLMQRQTADYNGFEVEGMSAGLFYTLIHGLIHPSVHQSYLGPNLTPDVANQALGHHWSSFPSTEAQRWGLDLVDYAAVDGTLSPVQAAGLASFSQSAMVGFPVLRAAVTEIGQLDPTADGYEAEVQKRLVETANRPEVVALRMAFQLLDPMVQLQVLADEAQFGSMAKWGNISQMFSRDKSTLGVTQYLAAEAVGNYAMEAMALSAAMNANGQVDLPGMLQVFEDFAVVNGKRLPQVGVDLDLSLGFPRVVTNAAPDHPFAQAVTAATGQTIEQYLAGKTFDLNVFGELIAAPVDTQGYQSSQHTGPTPATLLAVQQTLAKMAQGGEPVTINTLAELARAHHTNPVALARATGHYDGWVAESVAKLSTMAEDDLIVLHQVTLQQAAEMRVLSSLYGVEISLAGRLTDSPQVAAVRKAAATLADQLAAQLAPVTTLDEYRTFREAQYRQQHEDDDTLTVAQIDEQAAIFGLREAAQIQRQVSLLFNDRLVALEPWQVKDSTFADEVDLTMSPEAWRALTPHQQQELTREVQQIFGVDEVDWYQKYDDLLYGRPSADGNFNSVVFSPDGSVITPHLAGENQGIDLSKLPRVELTDIDPQGRWTRGVDQNGQAVVFLSSPDTGLFVGLANIEAELLDGRFWQLAPSPKQGFPRTLLDTVSGRVVNLDEGLTIKTLSPDHVVLETGKGQQLSPAQLTRLATQWFAKQATGADAVLAAALSDGSLTAQQQRNALAEWQLEIVAPLERLHNLTNLAQIVASLSGAEALDEVTRINPAGLGLEPINATLAKQDALVNAYSRALENGQTPLSGAVLLEQLRAMSSPFASDAPGASRRMIAVINEATSRANEMAEAQDTSLTPGQLDNVARAVFVAAGMGRMDPALGVERLATLPIVPTTMLVSGQGQVAHTAGELWRLVAPPAGDAQTKPGFQNQFFELLSTLVHPSVHRAALGESLTPEVLQRGLLSHGLSTPSLLARQFNIINVDYEALAPNGLSAEQTQQLSTFAEAGRRAFATVSSAAAELAALDPNAPSDRATIQETLRTTAHQHEVIALRRAFQDLDASSRAVLLAHGAEFVSLDHWRPDLADPDQVISARTATEMLAETVRQHALEAMVLSPTPNARGRITDRQMLEAFWDFAETNGHTLAKVGLELDGALGFVSLVTDPRPGHPFVSAVAQVLGTTPDAYLSGDPFDLLTFQQLAVAPVIAPYPLFVRIIGPGPDQTGVMPIDPAQGPVLEQLGALDLQPDQTIELFHMQNNDPTWHQDVLLSTIAISDALTTAVPGLSVEHRLLAPTAHKDLSSLDNDTIASVINSNPLPHPPYDGPNGTIGPERMEDYRGYYQGRLRPAFDGRGWVLTRDDSMGSEAATLSHDTYGSENLPQLQQLMPFRKTPEEVAVFVAEARPGSGDITAALSTALMLAQEGSQVTLVLPRDHVAYSKSLNAIATHAKALDEAGIEVLRFDEAFRPDDPFELVVYPSSQRSAGVLPAKQSIIVREPNGSPRLLLSWTDEEWGGLTVVLPTGLSRDNPFGATPPMSVKGAGEIALTDAYELSLLAQLEATKAQGGHVVMAYPGGRAPSADYETETRSVVSAYVEELKSRLATDEQTTVVVPGASLEHLAELSDDQITVVPTGHVSHDFFLKVLATAVDRSLPSLTSSGVSLTEAMQLEVPVVVKVEPWHRDDMAAIEKAMYDNDLEPTRVHVAKRNTAFGEMGVDLLTFKGGVPGDIEIYGLDLEIAVSRASRHHRLAINAWYGITTHLNERFGQNTDPLVDLLPAKAREPLDITGLMADFDPDAARPPVSTRRGPRGVRRMPKDFPYLVKLKELAADIGMGELFRVSGGARDKSYRFDNGAIVRVGYGNDFAVVGEQKIPNPVWSTYGWAKEHDHPLGQLTGVKETGAVTEYQFTKGTIVAQPGMTRVHIKGQADRDFFAEQAIEQLTPIQRQIVAERVSEIVDELVPSKNDEEDPVGLENFLEATKILPMLGRPDLVQKAVKQAAAQADVTGFFFYADSGNFGTYRLARVMTAEQWELMIRSTESSRFRAELMVAAVAARPELAGSLHLRLKDLGIIPPAFQSIEEFVAFSAHDKLRAMDVYRAGPELDWVLQLRRDMGDVRWGRLIDAYCIYDILGAEPHQLAFFEKTLTTNDPVLKRLGQMPILVRRLSPDELTQWQAVVGKALDSVDEIAQTAAELELGNSPTPEAWHDIKESHAWPEGIGFAERCAINDAVDTWALSKLYELSDGLTTKQVFTAVEVVRSFEPGASLRRLAYAGLTGEAISLIAQNGPAIQELMTDDPVVGETLRFLEILAQGDPTATLNILLESASSLSSPHPDWARLAQLATNLAIGDKAMAREDLYFVKDGQKIPFTQATPADLEAAISQALARALNPSPEEIQAANDRNKTFAESIADGRLIELPTNTMVHVTKLGAIPPVMSSANLPCECMGRLDGNSDAHPGFVDLSQLDEAWGSLGLPSIINHERLYSGDVVLAYFPDALPDSIPVGDGYLNHRLSLGGVGNTHLGAMILQHAGAVSAEELAALKQASIDRGLYVPILSESGVLLFTYEEFEAGVAERFAFDTLDDLLESPALFQDIHHDTLDTGGQVTLAQHLDTVRDNTAQLLALTELSPAMERVVLAAARLHDIGKTKGQTQEVSNVRAAHQALDRVQWLDVEEKRRILQLIKYDELLGEILKAPHMTPTPGGDYVVDDYAQKKLVQFERIFGGPDSDPEIKQALLILYQADVQSRDGQWDEWDVAGKLAFLGEPVYSLADAAAALGDALPETNGPQSTLVTQAVETNAPILTADLSTGALGYDAAIRPSTFDPASLPTTLDEVPLAGVSTVTPARLQSKLNDGSVTVLLGELSSGRPVALKPINPKIAAKRAGDGTLADWTLSLARSAQLFSDLGVGPIFHGLHEHDGATYLVMDVVPGDFVYRQAATSVPVPHPVTLTSFQDLETIISRLQHAGVGELLDLQLFIGPDSRVMAIDAEVFADQLAKAPGTDPGKDLTEAILYAVLLQSSPEAASEYLNDLLSREPARAANLVERLRQEGTPGSIYHRYPAQTLLDGLAGDPVLTAVEPTGVSPPAGPNLETPPAVDPVLVGKLQKGVAAAAHILAKKIPHSKAGPEIATVVSDLQEQSESVAQALARSPHRRQLSLTRFFNEQYATVTPNLVGEYLSLANEVQTLSGPEAEARINAWYQSQPLPDPSDETEADPVATPDTRSATAAQLATARIQQLQGGRVLDFCGGPGTQLPGAINVDLTATAQENEHGVQADVLHSPFASSSADLVVASGPRADVFTDAARVLKPGGLLVINASPSNKFGRLPKPDILDSLGFRVVFDGKQLLDPFSEQDFRRSDGTPLFKPENVTTIVLEKVTP